MDTRREQAIVGLFVLFVATLLVIVLLLVRGYQRGDHTTYRAYFRNAAGLERGQVVRFGGIEAGRIERVRVDPGDSSRIELTVRVDAALPVKVDSIARIASLGALGDYYLEITPGSSDAARLPADSEIPSEPHLSIAELAGRFEHLAPKLERLLQHVDEAALDLQIFLGEENQENVARSLSEVRGMLEESRPQVTGAVTNVNAASARLEPILAELEAALADTRGAIGGASGLIDDNRADVRAAIVKLRASLEQVDRLTLQARRLLLTNAESIDEVIDNLRLATEDFRRFTDQLSANPSVLIRGTRQPEHRPGEAPVGVDER